MLLQVAQLGNPILRQKAKKVVDVGSSEVQELIGNMIETCMDVDGVGIAAPQVYQPFRVFIVASHPNPRYPKAPEMEPTAMINPKMVSKSKETEKDWEGCLSVPGIRGLVPRHKSIEVEYTDLKNKKVRRKFSGFVARVFQHEYDHIEGVMFVDRADSRDLISDKEYQKLMAK